MSEITRTKAEYQLLVQQLQDEYGSQLTLPIIKLNQSQKYQMLSAPIRTDISHLLFQRLPRGYDTPDGIQRAFKPAKINEIAEMAKKREYTAPGSMVATIDTNRPSATIVWNNDKKTGHVLIDLKQINDLLDKQEIGEDGELREEEFKIGYMIDAHHRTEGHYRAERMDFEMNATIYTDLERPQMAAIFSGVNDKQEKPSPTHTLAMREMAGILSSSEEQAIEIINTLNDDKTSILYERVKVIDGRRPSEMLPAYVNLKPMTDLLSKHVIPHFAGDLTIPQRVTVLENYFRAWQEIFPEAWKDNNTHVLVKAMGFSIMGRAFADIYKTVRSKFLTNVPNCEQFVYVIKELKQARIDVGMGHRVLLDWNSPTFGSMSSGKGINYLSQQLQTYINDRFLAILGVA